MNQGSRRLLLLAFDALSLIENGRSPVPSKSSRGGSRRCDFCNTSLASGPRHAGGCPVGMAKEILLPQTPTFQTREQWIAEGEPDTRMPHELGRVFASADAAVQEPNPWHPIDDVLTDIRHEVLRAELKHAPMNSAHEGYAVIAEEVDELWDEVKKQTSARRNGDMHTECVQIAAMAIRFVLNIVQKRRAFLLPAAPLPATEPQK